MKILFVFTGGTIGSTERDGVIATDSSKSYKIIDFYRQNYGIDFEYDTVRPYVELSENNTGANLRKLCLCVSKYIDRGYDGIIVTHGTDTLQYSAAALGYTLGLSKIPVCIVSANRPIEHEASNALSNLHGAVKFIELGENRGVFVVYRNDNSDRVFVHRATRLVGVKAFSDEVASIGDEVYGSFDKGFRFTKNGSYKENDDDMEVISPNGLQLRSREILFVTPYVGMTFPALRKSIKYVIFNTFHSGTIDTNSSAARRFFSSLRKRGIKIYAVGVKKGVCYESAECFDALGITPLCNIAPISAYVKLWLLSRWEDTCVDELLKKSLSGDIIPSVR